MGIADNYPKFYPQNLAMNSKTETKVSFESHRKFSGAPNAIADE